MLALGFTLSALTAYAVVWLSGSAMRVSGLSLGLRVTIAGAVLACWAVIDTGVLGFRAPSWRRQTPRKAFDVLGPTRAALLWGLDTGLTFTTYRVTSLTWVAFTASLLHLVPWWSGLAYAVGFVLPNLVAIHLVPTDPRRSEPFWLTAIIAGWERTIRRVALAGLVVVSLGCLATGLANLS
jgi:hypothetical protein